MPSKRSGFTILEVLIAAAIMSFMGLVLVQVHALGRTTYSHQSGRVGMQHLARETLDRIHPLLVSANGATPVLHPPAGTANADDALVFESTADFFTNNFFDPTNPTSHRYRIRLNNDDIVLELYDGDVVSQTRFLARSNGARTVQGLTFTRPDGTLSTVRVRVQVQEEVRNAVNQLQTLDYSLETATHIPYFTTKTD